MNGFGSIFGCCGKVFGKDSKADKFALSELITQPITVDSSLENEIIEWQSAITEYESFEETCMDEYASDIVPFLDIIRTDPSSCIDAKYENIVQELALKKLKVMELQELLEAAGGDEDIKDEASTSPLHELQINEKMKDSLSDTSKEKYANKVSKTWENRLNRIDPTQGTIRLQSPEEEEKNTPTSKNKDVKIKPKWPEYLIDTYYDVVKVNKYGHKMRRILKLNQHHILGIKNGTQISKVYSYNDIRRIWLERDDTIHIIRKDNKWNIYMSPIAAHILQQISTRVQVRRSLDKMEIIPFQQMGYTNSVISGIIKSISEENTEETEAVLATFAADLKDRTIRALSVDLRLKTVESIVESENEMSKNSIELKNIETISPFFEEKSEVIEEDDKLRKESSTKSVQFDDQINENTLLDEDSKDKVPMVELRTISKSVEENVEMGKEDKIPDFNQETDENHFSIQSDSEKVFVDLSEKPIPPPKSPSQSPTKNKLKPKLHSFKEGTPEWAVQREVQSIIFNSSTSEGNTRRLFIEEFTSSSNEHNLGSPSVYSRKSSEYQFQNQPSLLDIRHFIDGMHEYILSNHAVALALLYEREKKLYRGSNFNPSLSADTKNGSEISNGLNSPARNESKDTTSRLPARHRRMSYKVMSDQKQSLSVVEDSVLVFVSFIIFTVVEEALFLPLKSNILAQIDNSLLMQEETAFLAKKKLLSRRTQEQWGIPEEFISPLCWQSAVFELTSIEHNLTPSSQLHRLTRTVKAIYNEFKHIVLPNLKAKGKSEVYIGADDLVPIFIYVFCQSDLAHPLRNRDIMWNLCHPDQLHGEGGYYLTVYESSIEFIQAESLNIGNSQKSDLSKNSEISDEDVEKILEKSMKSVHSNYEEMQLQNSPFHRSSVNIENSGNATRGTTGTLHTLSVDSVRESDKSIDIKVSILAKLVKCLCFSQCCGRKKDEFDYNMRESFY